MEFLRQSIESHDRQLGEIAESIQKNDHQIERLTVNMEKMADLLGKLTTIALARERRISDDEGQN